MIEEAPEKPLASLSLGTPWADNRFATKEKAQDRWWPAAASTEHRNFCVLGSEITSKATL